MKKIKYTPPCEDHEFEWNTREDAKSFFGPLAGPERKGESVDCDSGREKEKETTTE